MSGSVTCYHHSSSLESGLTNICIAATLGTGPALVPDCLARKAESDKLSDRGDETFCCSNSHHPS